MKKIIFIVCLLMSLLASFLIAFYVHYSSYQNLILFENTVSVQIKDNPEQYPNPADFLNAVSSAAEQQGVSISRLSYRFPEKGSPTSILYTTALSSSPILSNVRLQSGTFLSGDSKEEDYLSTLPSGDKNQIGVIDCFNHQNLVEIRPFIAQRSQNLTAVYTLDTQSRTTTAAFTQSLKTLGIESTALYDYNVSALETDTFLLYCSVLLFITLYLFVLVAFLYYLNSYYKEFAVRNILGSTKKAIIYRTILKDISLRFLAADALSFLITMACVGYYNHFSGLSGFLFLWFLLQAILFFGSCFIFLLFCQILKKVRVPQVLKNQNQTRANTIANLSVKILTSALIVIVASFAMQNILLIRQGSANMQYWDSAKNLASLWYTPTIPPCAHTDNNNANAQDDTQQEQLDEDHMKDLFVQTNLQGGVLFSPSNYYIYHATGPDKAFLMNEPEYSPYKNAVYINNNYLALHPIYDTDGHPVQVKDENTTEMTLLVPEKYKAYESDILKRYAKERTWRYYGREDAAYRKAHPDQANFESIDKHGAVPIKILYVKDNQNYFTFNTEYCKENGNQITDPVAMVANNANLGAEEYMPFISKEEYFVHIQNQQNPKEELDPILKQTGTDVNIIRVNPIYKTVEQQMVQKKNQVWIMTFVMGLSLAVLIINFIISATTYLEEKKKVLSVKTMFGFSFLKRYGKYYLSLIIFWAVLSGVLTTASILIQSVVALPVSFLVSSCIFLFVLEMVLATLLIRKKGADHILSILKI